MRAAMMLQARLLEAAIDLADQIAGHAVGLDDGQGALERHCRGLRASGNSGRECSPYSASPAIWAMPRKSADVKAFQTVKLSPQPHSPLTLGFRKRKASFSPCLHEIDDACRRPAAGCADRRTPSPRGPRTPGRPGRLIGVVDDVGEARAAGLAHAERRPTPCPRAARKS